METIEIKPVTTGDIETLQQIGRQTFNETFADGNEAIELYEKAASVW